MTISLIYMEEVLNKKNFKVYLHVTSGPSFPQFIDSKSVPVILFQYIFNSVYGSNECLKIFVLNLTFDKRICEINPVLLPSKC